MWRVLLSLLILFMIGRIILFFVDQSKPTENLTFTEVVIYSFSLGYAVLTLVGIVLAQFGLLTQLVTVMVIVLMPVLAVHFWIHKKRKGNAHLTPDLTRRDQTIQEQSISRCHARAIKSKGMK